MLTLSPTAAEKLAHAGQFGVAARRIFEANGVSETTADFALGNFLSSAVTLAYLAEHPASVADTFRTLGSHMEQAFKDVGVAG